MIAIVWRAFQLEIRTSLDELYRVMSRREEFRWMMLRIKRMEEPWLSAVHSLSLKQDLRSRRRKKVRSPTPAPFHPTAFHLLLPLSGKKM